MPATLNNVRNTHSLGGLTITRYATIWRVEERMQEGMKRRLNLAIQFMGGSGRCAVKLCGGQWQKNIYLVALFI